MIEYGGVLYYVDIKQLDKVITLNKGDNTYSEKKVVTTTNSNGDILTEDTVTTIPRNKEVDPIKFDIIKTFLDVVIDYGDEEDEDSQLGADNLLEKKPLGFKIAFNTLLELGILKEKE